MNSEYGQNKVYRNIGQRIDHMSDAERMKFYNQETGNIPDSRQRSFEDRVVFLPSLDKLSEEDADIFG